jgi:hypothetical protein
MKELTTTSSSGTGLASSPSTPANGLIGPLPNGGDKFSSKPLPKNVDSIRLIILKPCVKPIEEKDDSVVRCELSHVTFAHKPQYEALSYTWGDPNDLKDIIVDGLQMTVRANLYSALLHLRAKKPRVLWDDAICIDQSNPQ